MTRSTELSQVLEISKNMIAATGNTNKSLLDLGGKVAEVFSKVDEVVDEIQIMKFDIVQIKEHEEITTQQASDLRNLVSRKVYSLLTNEEIVIYGRKVFSDCWRFLANFGCLRPYATTPKKSFDDIVKGLKSYDPDLAMLKAEVDKSNLVIAHYQEKLKENN